MTTESDRMIDIEIVKRVETVPVETQYIVLPKEIARELEKALKEYLIKEYRMEYITTEKLSEIELITDNGHGGRFKVKVIE